MTIGPAASTPARIAHDPHRPRYHFLPPANWMNDPNGLIQWRGRYHLFYQHDPTAPKPGTIHWGHALSDDLVHWRDLPLALSPTPGAIDESAVFSGCAVDDHGTATVVYTGVRRASDGSRTERPCLATSTDDDLRTWTKHDGNPVIAAPPPGLDVLGFRDHSVWRDDGVWYQAIGSGIRGVGGAVLLYRSPDLRDWEYVGPLVQGDVRATGEMWECPDFFRLGARHVLMVSPVPLRKTIYFTGDYRAHQFVPAYQGMVDDGGCLYAPQSFTDAQGRRIMFGWLLETRDVAAQLAAGWAGVMSLPRLLTPRADGRIGFTPVPELQSLRREETTHGAALEIELEIEIDAGSTAVCGLRVPCTSIVYDANAHTLAIGAHATPFALEPDEPLRLHVFVDHSVVEVFANNHTCLTSRVYPSPADSLDVEPLTDGQGARVREFRAWRMDSIWPGVD